MRLIDADKLEMKEVHRDTDGWGPQYGVFAYQIREAPTIDAIPVEWIENGIHADLNFALNDPREGSVEERDGIVHCISGAFAAQVLMNTIALWRRENEID